MVSLIYFHDFDFASGAADRTPSSVRRVQWHCSTPETKAEDRHLDRESSFIKILVCPSQST